MRYIIANWKAQMSFQDIKIWLKNFKKIFNKISCKNLKWSKNLTIVICPPFPYILYVREYLKDFSKIKIGAQDISTFLKGKYTGEVTAHGLQEICDLAIIGHSERRSNCNESDRTISTKISLATKFKINPILCIRTKEDIIDKNVKIIAYEPVGAIGTGKNADASSVVALKNQLKLLKKAIFIYGGSADSTNIQSYLATKQIDGFLVGTASLHPDEFCRMIVKMLEK